LVDINLNIDEFIRKYLESKNREIHVTGETYICVKTIIS